MKQAKSVWKTGKKTVFRLVAKTEYASQNIDLITKELRKTDKTAISIQFQVILSLVIHEAECRRKILKGRRTISRYYYEGTAIPAWAIIVIVGVIMLVLGGGLYAIMRKIVLGSSNSEYSPAAVNES